VSGGGATPVLRVAVPVPLAGLLDYLPPLDLAPAALVPGLRLEVALGKRRVVGVLVEVASGSALPRARLKPALRALEATPEVPAEVVALARWAADYYHHPLGEVLAGALPVLLRDPRGSAAGLVSRYALTAAGRALDPASLARAPAQRALLARLREAGELDPDALEPGTRRALRVLVARGAVASEAVVAAPAPNPAPRAGPPLNAAQASAVAAIDGAAGGFAAFLLEGVTGSGKTEVYLHAVAAALARGRQALVLVPEIALTPQLVGRFRARFAAPVVALHSDLADGARLANWRAARDGQARVVLGTRSAVFAPLPELGLIVVDEEHDLSYKQHEGLRYHARDLALVRAQRAQLPVVMGSATPALESLANAASGRYRRLALPERAGGAQHPKLEVIDLRQRRLSEGLSEPLLARMRVHLAAGGQALLFLNRRGYAPRLTCHGCGWLADCQRCDARLVTHHRAGVLRCHHCGAEQRLPSACPSCGSAELTLLGRGTERIEQALAALFPTVGIARVDRDTTRRRGALDALLEDAHSGRARILVGTQMLAKGHDFPSVTLVGVVEADHGLFGADLRAAERMAQLITQVAGRAGRAELPGEVLIQTRHPDHPLLAQLLAGGYPAFAAAALEERRAAGLPPFAALALLRAEAADPAAAEAVLVEARRAAEALASGVELLGPAPAPMARRAGRHRAQLLLRADQRSKLQDLLLRWVPALAALRGARRARLSLDVDPQELL
jgi:primosomal protein N' (replication factor Y)